MTFKQNSISPEHPAHRGMSRRAAAKLIALAAGSPFLVDTSVAGESTPIWKTAIGPERFPVRLRKYKKNYPIWEVLDFASRHGFEGVELVGDWPCGGYPAAKEKDRVRALAATLRLFWAAHLLDPTRRRWRLRSGRSGATSNGWSNSATASNSPEQLGCDCVGMWPGGGLRGQTIDQAIDRAGADVPRGRARSPATWACWPASRSSRVFVFNKEDHYLRILHGADHPALKGIYDPSHFDQMNGATGSRRNCCSARGREEHRLRAVLRHRQHAARRRHLQTPRLRRRPGTARSPCGF